MLEWKNKWAPDFALFLKGPRRVGKTTLAKTLGENEYKSYITISFDEAPSEILNLFVESLDDLDNFYSKLQVHYKTKLYRDESLIILDEIQLYPLARQALKALLNDKRYHFLETGSLASIKKKSKNILIPSEEYHLDVLPLDFEEFSWALDETMTFEAIKHHYEKNIPVGSLNKTFMNLYRQYMLIGGMPQAINAYLKSKDYGDVDFMKQAILNLYEGDIDSQEEVNPSTVKNFFWHIPSELSKHDKRYVLAHLDNNARLREYKSPINWLNEAMIVNIAENVTDPSAAFNLSTVDPSFKCYMMDTGLLVSLAYKNKNYLENNLYHSILFDKLHVNEGMLIENLTAQTLRSKGDFPYFYKKNDSEKKKTVMEIDFIIRRENKIIPIEVKSSSAESITSLKKFKETFNNRIGQQYVLYDGDIAKKDGIIYLPYYMAIFL